jgi:hypothetical protein
VVSKVVKLEYAQPTTAWQKSKASFFVNEFASRPMMRRRLKYTKQAGSVELVPHVRLLNPKSNPNTAIITAGRQSLS